MKQQRQQPDRFDHLFIQPADYDAALAFYRDALGWQVLQHWGGEDQPRGCMLGSAAGMQLVLAEPHPTENDSQTTGVAGHRPTLHLRVDNLDARFAALGPQAQVVQAIEATHWGTRWFVLRDPDGNLIAYEQSLT